MCSVNILKLKAVVFDWDLTLWNSWDIHVWLMRRTADSLGLPQPEPDAIAREYSRPFLQHLSWFFGGDQDTVLDAYMEFYRENVAEMAGLYPGIEEALAALKQRGFQLAIFSDKRHAFGMSELDQTSIGHLLDNVSFLVEGRPYKPDPIGLLQVTASLGVSAGDAIYVGDSRQDIECAHKAGTRRGAALWGSVDRQAVLARKLHYRWESMEQMLGSLGVEQLKRHGDG